ncbi:MAG: hypothetical protein CENE_02404 [Candidatus Celerinatantimonas neptuna]|nr:MAG: hypothetical protein CENE_02404 [Candidatus Celerinatantimonas neptuna]
MPEGLPFKLTDYLELVELTGRMVRDDKRGAINLSLLPILQRLNLTSEDWLDMAGGYCKKNSSMSVGHSNQDNRHMRQRC